MYTCTSKHMCIARQQRKMQKEEKESFQHPNPNKHTNAHIKDNTHERPGHQMPSLGWWVKDPLFTCIWFVIGYNTQEHGLPEIANTYL